MIGRIKNPSGGSPGKRTRTPASNPLARPPRASRPANPITAIRSLAPLPVPRTRFARLEAGAQAASPAVAEGLRARISYREAAGWLGYAHLWVHPDDLALRDAGLTGSYGPAARAGRLEAELPATIGQESGFNLPPSDLVVELALRLARLWRRLAEFRTWAPLSDAGALREALQSLGYQGAFTDADADTWLASVHARDQGPALIRAGRAARDWLNRPGVSDLLGPDGLFLAACLWREAGFGRGIALPFWSAPAQRQQRLALKFGLEWMAAFLDCVTEAARVARGELARLQQAEAKLRALPGTARSKLPEAAAAALRLPVITARQLASNLKITPQAALGLQRRLLKAGIIREATGRASWRAFVIA
jgi:hypothetical protein